MDNLTPAAPVSSFSAISIFSRKFARICKSRCTACVVFYTGGKITSGFIDTSGKFTTGNNNTSGHTFPRFALTEVTLAANVPPVSTTLAVNLPLVSTMLHGGN
jgi:hypothetical protein